MLRVGLGLLWLLLGVLLASCWEAPTPTATPSPAPPTLAPPGQAPTTPALPPASPTPPPALALTIFQPPDEAVVTQKGLLLEGQAAPDSVVSVNGRIIQEVDEEGRFRALVTLTEGPNLLEVIATDYQGNQTTRLLTVIYLP